jgi:aldehyde reductase
LASEGEVGPVVKAAILEHGYRQIDTASLYQNEDAIGDALQEAFAAGIKREDLYITTKIWQTEKDDVEGAVRRSLKKLKLDYIDLYLIHAMTPKMVWEDGKDFIKATPQHKVWAELERLVDEGLIKSIGVSNCTIPMLIDLWSYARHKPVINQVEVHPYNVREDFVQFHNKLGVKIQAYAPLGANNFSGRSDKYKGLNLLEEPVIKALSEKYGKSPAQIILNWHLHRGLIIIPKTAKVTRLQENFQVYDFKLTEEEYQSISALEQGAKFFDPRNFGGSWGNIPYYD